MVCWGMDLASLKQTHIDGIVPGKGMVVSDLHLGKHWTRGDRTLEKIHTHIDKVRPSLIVFNGDIIEAEHLTGTREEAVDTVRTNMAKLREVFTHALRTNTDCKFAYILGNHDATIEIIDALADLQKEFPDRISVHSGSMKLHNVLFTHGDLLASTGKDCQSKRSIILENALNRFTLPAKAKAGKLERPESGFGSIKSLHPAEGAQAKHRQRKDVVFGSIDQVAAWFLYPMKHIMPGVLATLEAYPEFTHDVDTVMLGHFHLLPNFNTAKGKTSDGKTIHCYVTGPSTGLSLTSMYDFTIGKDRVSDISPFATQQEKLAGLPDMMPHAMGSSSWRQYLDAPYYGPTDKSR